jgi:DNA-binding GntR family transcriptional regulator
MKTKSILNLKSLKEQVYDYFRKQMQTGKIRPGSMIKMDTTSKILGVSKTPLRDALILLEKEGFVTINPRKGVIVNELTLDDIRNIYQVIGALESMALLSSASNFEPADIKRMEDLIDGMKKAIAKDNFNGYYAKNLMFHNCYIKPSGNNILFDVISTLKKRLYDFPRLKKYVKEWEETSIIEHEQLLALIAGRKFEEAANFIREVHWSFKVQEKYIKEYYSLDEK